MWCLSTAKGATLTVYSHGVHMSSSFKGHKVPSTNMHLNAVVRCDAGQHSMASRLCGSSAQFSALEATLTLEKMSSVHTKTCVVA